MSASSKGRANQPRAHRVAPDPQRPALGHQGARVCSSADALDAAFLRDLSWQREPGELIDVGCRRAEPELAVRVAARAVDLAVLCSGRGISSVVLVAVKEPHQAAGTTHR